MGEKVERWGEGRVKRDIVIAIYTLLLSVILLALLICEIYGIIYSNECIKNSKRMLTTWGKTRTKNPDGAASQFGPFPCSMAM